MKDFFKNKNLNHEIDPDTAVALGAAIIAQQCHGEKSIGGLPEIENPVIDLCPVTLGILLGDNTVSPIIKKNHPVPAQEIRRYTNQHNRELLDICFVRGDNPDGGVIRSQHCEMICELR